jgi:S1-C subfamily serine protease
MNRIIRRIGALFIAGIMLLTPVVVSAEEVADEAASEGIGGFENVLNGEAVAPEVIVDINSARNGVVQVNYVYIDDNDVSHIIKGGTGFIIGSAEKTEYVLTCESNITMDKETKNSAFKYLGIPKEKNGDYKDVRLEVQVVAASDVTVNARIIATSTELDLAVLELSQPIHTRAPLSIYTSENGSREALPYAIADKVFALGFPDEIIFEANEKYYSNDRIVMTTGSIANIATLDDVYLIQHDATVGRNNCGGPLINEDGKVIGMNVVKKDGDYFCALDSTEIVEVLDALGVEYTKTFYEEEAPVEASTEALSVEVEETPVEPVVPVYLIILAVILCMFLIAAVVIAIVLIKRKDSNKVKKEAKKEPEIKPFSPGNIPTSTGAEGLSNGGETSMLNVPQSNGTTVLGSGQASAAGVISGTLIRKRDKKQGLIDKPVFTIGKDSLHSDFYINDNAAISRAHAIIKSAADGVYIEDCNSTNGTYVNGKRVITGQPVKLTDGSIIKLADDEFEYRI